ncbi:MAG: VWA domain-containing protein [Methanotrichaceae archaeon]|nr:VWA domain-containing protein [Methanotrichaceae archaeon]
MLRGAFVAILGLAFITIAFCEAAPLQLNICEGGEFSSSWYSMSGPPDEWSIAPFMQAEPADESKFWIVDCSGSQKETSLEVPSLGWVRLLLAPAADGELSLHIQYPTGTVERELLGSVTAGSQYLIWHQAEAAGDYELWYSVDGENSSSIDLSVPGPEVFASPWSGAGSSGGSLGRGAAIPVATPPMPLAMSSAAESIGFSVGGAKDIGNFRENIEEGYLPLPTDVTYEGLFYDYYFDLGSARRCDQLFCPAYSSAISSDPLSEEPCHYLSVGLDSGITDFSRKKLNLVVVLDNSGSMASAFDRYYYDQLGNLVDLGEDNDGRSKMEIADRAVLSLMGHLGEGDRFGLVKFNNEAFLVDPLTLVEDKDLLRLKDRILDIEADGGTNMEAGMEKARRLFDRLGIADRSEYENRIIFITDAMPNIGETGEAGLSAILEEEASRGVYTTFIGVGVDFNSELAERIATIRGANYYSVHSEDEFQSRMDDEFDYMVSPLVFDLVLQLDVSGYRIAKVYGAPKADLATGEIMVVETLFPSKKVEGEVRGGLILVKLEPVSLEGGTPQGTLRLRVGYTDSYGRPGESVALVDMPPAGGDAYQSDGIRKGILLARYADLLKSWMADERSGLDRDEVSPAVTFLGGIPIFVELGEWERQSLPLRVSPPYGEVFRQFAAYFQVEMEAIGDGELEQEMEVLRRLEDVAAGG